MVETAHQRIPEGKLKPHQRPGALLRPGGGAVTLSAYRAGLNLRSGPPTAEHSSGPLAGRQAVRAVTPPVPAIVTGLRCSLVIRVWGAGIPEASSNHVCVDFVRPRFWYESIIYRSDQKIFSAQDRMIWV